MPRKTNELAPITITGESALDVSSAALGFVDPTTKDEKRIVAEGHKHQVIIAAHSEKALLAETEISRVHHHGVTKFSEAAKQYTKIFEEAEGTPVADYLAAYIQYDAESLARHLKGVMDVHALTVTRQAGESVVPALEAEKPGLWKRITGDY